MTTAVRRLMGGSATFDDVVLAVARARRADCLLAPVTLWLYLEHVDPVRS